MSPRVRGSPGRKSPSRRKTNMLIAGQLSLAATYETGPPGHIRSGREPAAERSKTARSRSPRSSPFYTSIVTARWRGHALARRANLARTQPCNGSARGASRPHAQHPARIVRAVRAEIGLQQREHHQVELCAATADAFEFAGNRFKRVDRGREISPLESGEGVRHRRNAGAGWRTTVARELVHLPGARLQRRVIASHDLRERDVHVGKGHAGARKRAGRKVVHHAHALASRGCPASSQRHRKETASFTFPRGGPLCTSGAKASRKSRNAAAVSPASRWPSARCQLRWLYNKPLRG